MAAQAKLSALFKEAKEKLLNPPDPPKGKKEQEKTLKKELSGTEPKIKREKATKRRENGPDTTRLRKKNNTINNNRSDPRNPRTVFIGNVPLSTKKKDILKLVSPYGSVESLRQRSAAVSPGKLPIDVARKLGKQLTGTTTNFYVVMETEESASACLELNGREVEGRHIRVDLATPTNDTHCSVFVGNVPFGADEEKLRKVFESCGPIDGIRIIKDTRTGINKGFAYIKFKDSSSVLFACKKNERIELEGRKLRVFRCRSNKSKFQTKFGGAKSQVGRNKKLLKSFQPSKRKGKNDKKKTKMRRKEKSIKRKEKTRKINK